MVLIRAFEEAPDITLLVHPFGMAVAEGDIAPGLGVVITRVRIILVLAGAVVGIPIVRVINQPEVGRPTPLPEEVVAGERPHPVVELVRVSRNAGRGLPRGIGIAPARDPAGEITGDFIAVLS